MNDYAAYPWLCLFDPEDDKSRRERNAVRAGPDRKRENRLFCLACRALITDQDECVSMQGAHEHVCTNPHGLAFRVGCFRSARGCRQFGEATSEHTWFQGYRWRIALCAKCQAHLGWIFEASAGAFYGLILDRLTSRPGD